jgi:hypothetical protein
MAEQTSIEWAANADGTSGATTLAYLAGVIDSDGYISIQRVVRKGKRYHCAIVGIAGTRREPHDLAASIWGGKIIPYTPKNPRHRTQFQWQRSGRSAVPVINAVLPYLLVKVQQALLALECEANLEEERAGGDDPFPWCGPDYDPRDHRDEMREEIITHLNQGRRMPFTRA